MGVLSGEHLMASDPRTWAFLLGEKAERRLYKECHSISIYWVPDGYGQAPFWGGSRNFTFTTSGRAYYLVLSVGTPSIDIWEDRGARPFSLDPGLWAGGHIYNRGAVGLLHVLRF